MITTIATAIAAVGGLAGIAALLKTISSLKNDRTAGHLANESSAIEGLRKAADGYQDIIEDLKKERNEARAEARQYREDREAIREACLQAETGFCVNYGCPLRDPARGTGAAWIRSHADSPDIGGNYKSLEALMKSKNITIKD